MTITQTVEIPADHRLTIEVPREVPEGRAVLAFFPANVAEKDDADDSLRETGVECPICAAHRDPITGNPRYKPEIYASMREVDDMLSGKISSTLKRFNSFEEMMADLESDD
jgi:hypothetical protein